MEDDREYQYLHHSQSQLRERQFWFYHHDRKLPNLSFSDAYLWMGKFDREKNPAKYAARMALCFSTTKATVEVRV
jgi:RNA-dependent RNA polymerase